MLRELKRFWCWLTWHKWKRGKNGWENFGTGIYCSHCSAMLNDPWLIDVRGMFWPK